jgi:hypothetical protein
LSAHQRSLEKLAKCLRDHGWDSTVTGDSVTTHSTQDQQSALDADNETCSKGTLPDLSTLTDADWQKAYDLQVKTASCLQKLGFTVTVPSLQVFKQAKGQWNPYVDLTNSGAMSGPDVNKYERQCPQAEYFPGD